MLFESLQQAEEHKQLPFDYFQYDGSLTTPGCEEYTTWYIVDTVFSINGVALEFMHDSSFDPDHCSAHQYLPTYFTGTNRQLQPLHNRTVYHFSNKDYCGPTFNSVKEAKEDNADGHYEKVEKTQTKYYFVKGQEPSGMPGALVVSGDEEEEIKK